VVRDRLLGFVVSAEVHEALAKEEHRDHETTEDSEGREKASAEVDDVVDLVAGELESV